MMIQAAGSSNISGTSFLGRERCTAPWSHNAGVTNSVDANLMASGSLKRIEDFIVLIEETIRTLSIRSREYQEWFQAEHVVA